MQIAIDATRAVIESAGIGRYSLNLIQKLLEIDSKNNALRQYLLLFSHFRQDPQKAKILRSLQRPNVEIRHWRIPGAFKEKIWGWRVPWLNWLLKGADLFYAPSFLEVNLGLKIPQVVTIYDLTTFLFPELRGKAVSERLNERTKLACKKARKIIAISHSTKNDLMAILKIPAKKIQVIYPGRTEFPEPAKNLPKNLKSHSYILSVGTIEPRKNLIGLFKAYALLPPSIQEKFPLVIVGAEGWNTGKTFEVFQSLKLQDKVKFLGFVSDAVLAKLYKEAAVFVYPSLYEGFGLPVLEALSFGLPVVTSNVSSLPEVVGKAGVLVEPKDPKSIASGLQRILEHQNEAEELRDLAQKQAVKFSWEKAAKETLKVFEEVIRG